MIEIIMKYEFQFKTRKKTDKNEKKSTQIKGTQTKDLKSYAIKGFKLLIRSCL